MANRMKPTDEEQIKESAAKAVNCLSAQAKAELKSGLFDKRLEDNTRRICVEFFLNKAATKLDKPVVHVASALLCNDDVRAQFMAFVDEGTESVKGDLFKAAGMTKPANQ